jgi:putative ATP-dependent endonuclease of OLD family
MRLELFSVQNFRSIKKAEKLPLGEFTVLLGPNNEGKSNILQAMVLGMEELSQARAIRPRTSSRLRRRAGRTVGGYDWGRDFPRSLQQTQPDGKTTMRLDFQLTEDEVAEFYEEVGNRLNEALPISLVFGRAGPPQFRVRKPRHAEALSAKRKEIAEFVAERVEVQYVEAVRTGDSVRDIVETMLDRELAAAAADNPAFAAAVEKLREIQQPVFDLVSGSITERIRSLLPDVESGRLESSREGITPLGLGRGVSVIVDDGTATDLTLKGDGVQSLAALAMTQHYSAVRARAREFILAVEEPEAHLHPRAIHALREALRDTASTQQVVITTHSPLFANRLDLSSNIIVRRNRARPATSVQELRDALGVRTADNLASAELVLVVEGQSDELALKALLSSRSETLSSALETGLFTVMPLHGGGKLGYLLTQLRDSLASVHAFLDDDEQGRRAATLAEEEGLLGTADITMTVYPGGRHDAELEDFIAPNLYREAFLHEFGVNVNHPWLSKLSKGKWSKRMPVVFQASGTRWTAELEKRAKAIVAREIAARPLDALKPDGDAVVAALTESLESKLEQRSV